jgi:beta-lactamase regulating signal transducer with metallopeptidase domain
MGGFAAAGTLGLIAEYFFKTTAVLTLALLAAAASRRRPAAFRHFVLSFALVGLLFLPVLSLAPVGWRTSLLPTRPAGTETGTSALLPARPGVTGARAPGLDVQSPPPGVVRFQELPLASTADGPSPEFSSPPLSAAATSRLPTAGASPVNSLLAVLWAAGLIVLFLRLAVGLAGAVKLTAQGTALGDPAWRGLLERFRALVSLRRNIRLKSHPAVLVPLTWGWRKPVVLMPAGADAWTEEQRSSALFHELSHVKRADFLVMLLVRTSLAAFWFNPLCWVVYRELRKEQEIACDELVLRAGIRPSTYAASLLAFRRSAGFRWNPSAALLGMLGRSSFHERLAAILKQKLTFKEVKMKTKIMLASAVVLAVVLVGTARPAVGIEKTAVTTTIVETAAPAPVSLAVVLPVSGTQEKQAEKAVVQEKEKKKIVVTTKDGAKTPIEITITEGDKVKTLVLDKPLTITGGKDGHVLVLTSEGKEIQVLEGEPLRLEIRGGEIELIKEGKALKVGEGGKEGSKIVYYWTPEGKTGGAQEIRIVKEGKADEATAEVFVKRMKDKKEGEKWVAVETAKEATVGKEGAVWVTKEFSGKPVEGAWVSEGGKAFAFSSATDKDMLEKVHALQEQVTAIKAKKMDIDVLQKSLEKLEAELKAQEVKLDKFEFKFDKEPGQIKVVKKIRGEEAEAEAAEEAKAVTKVVAKDDGLIQIVLTGPEGDAGRKAYELAVAKLKKELPEGYRLLEQNYDADSGAMTFKIAPPEGKKSDEKLVQKLVESLRAEIDKK